MLQSQNKIINFYGLKTKMLTIYSFLPQLIITLSL